MRITPYIIILISIIIFSSTQVNANCWFSNDNNTCLETEGGTSYLMR